MGHSTHMTRPVTIAMFAALALPAAADDSFSIIATSIELEDLPAPHRWSGEDGLDPQRSLVFHVDLDLIAPLGEPRRNAAPFFALFQKGSGSRWAELREAVLVDSNDGNRRYEFDAPFVEEAEHWVRQGRLQFILTF